MRITAADNFAARAAALYSACLSLLTKLIAAQAARLRARSPTPSSGKQCQIYQLPLRSCHLDKPDTTSFLQYPEKLLYGIGANYRLRESRKYRQNAVQPFLRQAALHRTQPTN